MPASAKKNCLLWFDALAALLLANAIVWFVAAMG